MCIRCLYKYNTIQYNTIQVMGRTAAYGPPFNKFGTEVGWCHTVHTLKMSIKRHGKISGL